MGMAQEAKIRTFLALPLAPSFEAEVTPLIEKLRREYPEVKWVSPSQIHVTLHFFGSITVDTVRLISECAARAIRLGRPLSLFLSEIGGFPNIAHPRVIWLGMGGETEKLKSLQASLEQELKKEGFECEERSFKPHLTLGRIKEARGFRGFKPFGFGPTATKKITEIVLFQSHLLPGGAAYETIATYPLSAA